MSARAVKNKGSLKEHPRTIDTIKNTKIRNDIKDIGHLVPASSKEIKFDWYCKIHKHTWNTYIGRIIIEQHGCKYCSYDKMIATKKLKKHSRA